MMKQSSSDVASPRHSAVLLKYFLAKFQKDLCMVKPTQHKIINALKFAEFPDRICIDFDQCCGHVCYNLLTTCNIEA